MTAASVTSTIYGRLNDDKTQDDNENLPDRSDPKKIARIRHKNQLATPDALNHLKVVEQTLKDKISWFATYEDPSGNKSSGAAGLAKQINRLIKLHFAAPREEFSNSDIELLVALMSKIIGIIESGVHDQLTRTTIKKTIYAFIEKFAGLK